MEAWNLPAPPTRRWFGLDRRLLPGFILVIAVVLLWSLVMPAVNQAIKQDEIAPGTRVHMYSGVSFTPANGWIFGGQPLPGARDIEVSRSGTVFKIHVSVVLRATARGLFNAAAKAEDEFKTGGPVKTFSVNGVKGLAQQRFGSSSTGGIFVLQKGTTAAVVTVDGPEALIGDQTREIAGMIASIRFGEGPSK